MKLIRPSVEIMEQEPGNTGLFRHIERCGRTCYKSEDKITEDSAEKFVGMIINRGHTAMVEHGTVYLKFNNTMPNLHKLVSKYEQNEYSVLKYREFKEDVSNRGITYTEWYITTNYRVLLQNDWLDDLQYQCEPTEYHEKRITAKFTCDMGIAREFCRHKTALCRLMVTLGQ